MELRYLQEFITLVEVGNYSESSERLYISQSTLSKHMMALEDEIGVPLFIRTKRELRLSQEGEIFLKYAKEHIRIQKECQEALTRSIESGGRLVVAVPPAINVYSIPEIIVLFNKNFMGYTVSTCDTDPVEHMELLRKKKCELIMTRILGEPDRNLVCHCYLEDPLCAIVSEDHPFASREWIDFSELKDASLLLHPEGTMLCQLSKKFCREAGFDPKVAYYSHMLDALFDFAAKGMGIALTSRFAYESSDAEGICAVALRPESHMRFCLCSYKGRPLSHAASYFIICVKKVWGID